MTLRVNQFAAGTPDQSLSHPVRNGWKADVEEVYFEGLNLQHAAMTWRACSGFASAIPIPFRKYVTPGMVPMPGTPLDSIIA